MSELGSLAGKICGVCRGPALSVPASSPRPQGKSPKHGFFPGA